MGISLENITSPGDIKGLSVEELEVLADEIRKKMLDVTSRKGGHLGASLGTVELTLALHYCIDSPKDKIVWDVGHQSYAHKMLTGRVRNFDTLRELGGISGFPRVGESEHDHFTCGHSATSISSALGLAAARDVKGEDYKVVAVVGDASLATGLAFEGMNHCGHMRTNMIVVLNDNEHFISKPVGAMSRYLTKVITNPLYNKVKDETEKIINGIPKLGPVTIKTVKKVQEGMKNLLVPGILFEELGFRYFGPVDGHDIEELISILTKIRNLEEPVFLHTITKKGKGYTPAEENPVKFHGVTSFDLATGEVYKPVKKVKTFTEHFSDKIVELGEKSKKIVAITAAMPGGTGLSEFADRFPERFFDVGITEPHAVTFSAGLAKGGLRPVVAIYSTFLQRSYDQLIHDVALQKLPVVFCIDRGGLVGKDGPTHHGIFDISYMRSLPGFVVMAPKDGLELEEAMEKALEWDKPVAIRYPRADAERIVATSSCKPVEIGESEHLRNGGDVTIIALGSMVNTSLMAAEVLSSQGIEAEVINARFIKPIDGKMLEEVTHRAKKIFTVEESVFTGGFGSAVLEFLERENLKNIDITCLGLPDVFIEHGDREQLLREYHLTPDGLAEVIKSEMER